MNLEVVNERQGLEGVSIPVNPESAVETCEEGVCEEPHAWFLGFV